MDPSPTPKFDNPKMHMSPALQLFGAGRERRIYALPPYTRVVSLDFEDHPFERTRFDKPCALCGAEGVYLDDYGSTQEQLFGNVNRQRQPDVQLEHVNAVQVLEIGRRELEERPLIALHVDTEGEGQGSQGLGAGGVEQLDPEVHVAVRFRPGSVGPVKCMTRISARVEIPDAKRHSSRASRAEDGHVKRSKPCWR
jgi:hypothetical protein